MLLGLLVGDHESYFELSSLIHRLPRSPCCVGCVARSTPDDMRKAKKLGKHLEMVKLVEQMTPKSLERLDKDTIRLLLQKLHENKLDVQSDVKSKLWNLRIADMIKEVVTGNLSELELLCQAFCPWSLHPDTVDDESRVPYQDIMLSELDGRMGYSQKEWCGSCPRSRSIRRARWTATRATWTCTPQMTPSSNGLATALPSGRVASWTA